MEQALGEEFLNFFDEAIDKGKVPVATNPVLAVAKVVRIIQQLLVVGPGVNRYRQGLGRVNASGGGVDHQLPDRNIDPVDTPVTNSQDSLRIGDHDQANITTVRGIGQLRGNVLRMVDIQVGGILRPQVTLIVLFDGLGNYWIINNRHEFGNVLLHQVEKQGPVGIENFHQQVALFNSRRFRLVQSVGFCRLFFDRPHVGWQQAQQPQFTAFRHCKRRSFIFKGVI